MKEKKNIDRLFQEQFKEFEANPPEHVWENISAELKKDKKRRVIPIWFKLSGVAAVFIIGLLLVNFFGNEDDFNQNSVVNGNVNATDTTNTIANDNILPLPTTEDAVVNNDDNNSVIESENGSTAGPKNENSSNILSSEEAGSNDYSPASRNSGNNNLNNQDNAVVINSKTQSNNTLKNEKNNRNSKIKGVITNPNTAVANSEKSEKEENYLSEKNKADNSVIKRKDNGFINPNAENNNSIAEVNTDDNSGEENEPQSSQQEEAELLDKTPHAIMSASDDAIASEEINSEVVIDSASIIVPENELEKLLQEKLNGKDDDEEKLLAENDNLKWNIRPQMAPVFYNSLSQGSPIDSQFASNSKSYDNNMSYGVGIDYNITDRLAVRSGVNAVNLSYETRGVEFYPAMTKPAVASRNVGENSNLVVQSEANVASSPGPEGFASTTSIQSFKGSMVQEMGYIEVPVELSYALLNKKFGIDVIGGVSTLFLNNNDVRVITTQGYSSNLGEARNLNNVNFSTNIGIGFKYKFLKSFKASFEPMFKYQVNTFSENSGNFKPYFIGLYSGISFSF
ncbi:hypothetical protein GCM10007424_17380 [Flavobacterium suaedae]|uniref:Outer membrane protein beta-barrel domain-containing protein n=1 Tax=Flavobacterium suaedae TaxID=1767027 RepID=A0ABQ1JTY1_9FLAO|nr:outer membrane beta-barrel protein [Flavobacterium suaedae]GGB77824.1 hypothetical protein GCM10007424_17380 [Flavobacterium suaedae]